MGQSSCKKIWDLASSGHGVGRCGQNVEKRQRNSNLGIPYFACTFIVIYYIYREYIVYIYVYIYIHRYSIYIYTHIYIYMYIQNIHIFFRHKRHWKDELQETTSCCAQEGWSWSRSTRKVVPCSDIEMRRAFSRISMVDYGWLWWLVDLSLSLSLHVCDFIQSWYVGILLLISANNINVNTTHHFMMMMYDDNIWSYMI